MRDSTDKRYLDELVELEFDEDCIAYYLVDDKDKIIGVCLYEGDEQVEYLFEDEASLQVGDGKQLEPLPEISQTEIAQDTSGFKESLDMTRQSINEVKDDTKEIAAGLSVAAKELTDAYNELLDAFQMPDFPGFKGKRKHKDK